MHRQPLHQGLRQGQGEASNAQDSAIQGVRRGRLRQAGVQLQGHVPDLHAVIAQHLTFGSLYALMTFSYCCYIYHSEFRVCFSGVWGLLRFA